MTSIELLKIVFIKLDSKVLWGWDEMLWCFMDECLKYVETTGKTRRSGEAKSLWCVEIVCAWVSTNLFNYQALF